jgi:acetyl-CoA C-acetyltransferase
MSPAMQARYPGVQFSQFAGAEQLAVKYGLTKDALDDVRAAKPPARRGGHARGALRRRDRADRRAQCRRRATGEVHDADEGIRFDASRKASRRSSCCRRRPLSAATASQICDGAAALVVANRRGLQAMGNG